MIDKRIKIELLVPLPEALAVQDFLQYALSQRFYRLVDQNPDDPDVQVQFEQMVACVKFKRQIEDILFEIAKGE
jgi:hypothetical protein